MGEEIEMEEGNSQKKTAEAQTTGGYTLPDKSLAEVITMQEESHWGMRAHPLESESTPFVGDNLGDVEGAATKEEAVERARALIEEADKEKKTIEQFDEIRKLCGGENDFNMTATEKKLRGFVKNLCVGQAKLSTTGRDEVDSGGGAIRIGVLKTLIGRLDTEKNPANVMTIGGLGMEKSEERQKLYDILDNRATEKEGFLNYAEYRELINPTQDQPDSANHTRLVKYFKSMEEGKKIVKWPPPVFILLVTLIQFVLFWVCKGDHALLKTLEFHTDCILRRWWGYFTYSLLHVDFGHLFFNLLLQCGVGLGLEMVHGTISVMILFILGVLSGSLSFFCFDCGPLHGASGGVYCLIAASFSTCIMNWREDRAIFMTRLRRDQAPWACGGKLTRILKMLSLVCFFGLDFGYAAYRRYHDFDAGYSVIAHLGGTITGLLLGFIVLKDVKVQRWERLWKVVCASVFFFLMGLAFGVNLTGSRRATGLISRRFCSTNITDCAL